MFGAKMGIKFYINDDTKTYWEEFVERLDVINPVYKIILAIGFFYTILRYYRMYKESKNVAKIARKKRELDAADTVEKDRYEKLMEDFAVLRRRQEMTDMLVFKLRVEHDVAAVRANRTDERNDCGDINALKTADFYGLKKSNEKLIRKNDKLKLRLATVEKSNEKLIHRLDELNLRLGIVERDLTINSSVILNGACSVRDDVSAFNGLVTRSTRWIDQPAPHRSYSDENYRRPNNESYGQTARLVNTNFYGSSLPPSSFYPPPPPPSMSSCPPQLPSPSMSSCPPSPPPPSMSSCPPPPPPPSMSSFSPPPPPPPLPPPSMSSFSPPPPPPPPSTLSCPPPPPPPAPARAVPRDPKVTNPAEKVYCRIPITSELLKTVVLRKPGEVPPKIRVPVGMMSTYKNDALTVFPEG